jgi:hypothetical protein
LESLALVNLSSRGAHFDHFRLPALCNLQIAERSLGSNPIGSLTSFISKSGCRLLHIRIIGGRNRAAFPSIPEFSFGPDAEEEEEEEEESDLELPSRSQAYRSHITMKPISAEIICYIDGVSNVVTALLLLCLGISS